MRPIIDAIVALHDGLDAAGINHAFGGAFALLWCTGEPRTTVDIDLNVFAPPTETRQVLDALPTVVEGDRHLRLEAPRRVGLRPAATPPVLGEAGRLACARRPRMRQVRRRRASSEGGRRHGIAYSATARTKQEHCAGSCLRACSMINAFSGPFRVVAGLRRTRAARSSAVTSSGREEMRC